MGDRGPERRAPAAPAVQGSSKEGRVAPAGQLLLVEKLIRNLTLTSLSKKGNLWAALPNRTQCGGTAGPRDGQIWRISCCRVRTSSPVGAATRNTIGWVSEEHSFLTALEAGTSEIKELACSVLREGQLPGVQKAAFSLCPRMASSFCVCMWEGE